MNSILANDINLEKCAMDAESGLEAVDAIRATILQPDELKIFDEGIQNPDRYDNIGLATGMAAVLETIELPNLDRLAPVEVIDDVETDFELKLPYFLNPNIILNTADQLATMQEFWQQLGFQVPELDTLQQIKLHSILLENPNLRVVPTPFLDIVGRKTIVEMARATFSKNEIHPTLDALKTPHYFSIPGQLLADPEIDFKDRKDNFTQGLRYKTPTGEIVNRADYITALLESQQAISGENDLVWTFPVVDIAVGTTRKLEDTKNIMTKINPVCSPEALIAIQLLHQANGAPNTEWDIDIANEAVYRFYGNESYLMEAFGVYWYPISKQVTLYNLDVNKRKNNLGSRTTISGI